MSQRSGSGFFGGRHQFTFGSIQSPFARFPFSLGAMTIPAIELTECDVFWHILDELVPNQLKESP